MTVGTNLDLATESFLGDADADELGNQDARAKLALATRYIANWYKATSGSENKDVWYQKIDSLRSGVQTLYTQLTADGNPFLSTQQKSDYNAVSGNWADLWRQLMLSTDTIDRTLMSQAADFVTTTLNAPGIAIPAIFQSVGGIINDSVGKFMAQVWPVIIIAGVAGGIYLFRAPLSRLVK
jgi:hypothetical protein